MTEPIVKVYGFMYNSCIHESSWETISLHFDRNNAKKALWNHMKAAFLEYKEYKKYVRENWEMTSNFGTHEDWRINEFEILP